MSQLLGARLDGHKKQPRHNPEHSDCKGGGSATFTLHLRQEEADFRSLVPGEARSAGPVRILLQVSSFASGAVSWWLGRAEEGAASSEDA